MPSAHIQSTPTKEMDDFCLYIHSLCGVCVVVVASVKMCVCSPALLKKKNRQGLVQEALCGMFWRVA